MTHIERIDHRRRNTRYYRRHRRKVLTAVRTRRNRIRETNPKRYLFETARNNAKVSARTFSLTISDIPDIPVVCPVFPWMTLYYTDSEHNLYAPSLDRIDSSKGYVPGNVRIISTRANLLKSNATDLELIALGNDALSRKVRT